MAMATLSFSRLSQCFFGTLSLLHRTRPLFHQRTSQIRRQSGLVSIYSASPSDLSKPIYLPGRSRGPQSSSSAPITNTFNNVCKLRQPNEKLQGRANCLAANGGDSGGSAFISTSTTSEAEKSLYTEEVTRSINKVAVVTPLCERPATNVTCLEDLLQWRRKAEQLAASVGREFYEADGGPDSRDLLRELEWLLDDAVAACCRRGREVDSCARQWEACSWRDVKAYLPAGTVQTVLLTSTSSDIEGASKAVGDEIQEFGAFSTLLKERYTDPVSELAADGACCCDSLRDSLADMASDPLAVGETKVEGVASVKLATISEGNFPDFEDVVERHDSRTTSAHVLLRTSIEELEEQWTQRVRERRPFQYVVGCAHWRDLVLSVQEGILIPRPETEQMIDLAEAAIATNRSLGDGVWVDLGTGSGALAISLARLLPQSGSVIAVDSSEIAVAVARRNVDHFAVMDRVRVVCGSWFSPLENVKGTIAGVLSNPPYIPSANLAGLQAEVGKHEPETALDGGEDGMSDLRLICQGSARALQAGGFLALETNGGQQAEAVSDLLHSLRTVRDIQSNLPVPCFRDINIVPDFAGIMRFVVATRC